MKRQLKQEFRKSHGVRPPHRTEAVREFHGEKLPDPYQYLDEAIPAPVQRWIDELEREYQKYTSGNDATEEFVKNFCAQAQKGIPQQVGQKYLFYLRKAGEQAFKIMVSDEPEGEGRVLVDPGDREFRGANISPDGKLLLYILKKPGDWVGEVHICEIATGKQLEVAAVAAAVQWDKDGRGFTYNQEDENEKVIYRHHALGGTGDDPKVETASWHYMCFRNHASYEGPQEWRFKSLTTGQNNLKPGLAMKDPATGEWIDLFKPGEVDVIPIADSGGKILAWTTEGASNGRVVLIDPRNPQPANWQTVIDEDKDAPLKHVFAYKGRLMALYDHNCAEQLRSYDMQGGDAKIVPIPGPARIDFSHGARPGTSLGVDAPPSDELMFSVSSYTSPPVTYKYDPFLNEVTPIDTTPSAARYDQSGLIIEQVTAKAKDGTDIPMTVIRRPDVALDGSAAVLLEGYGGYGIPQGPQCSPHALDFLRSGGIYVQTHIRGGGEGGLSWHQGGQRLRKENCVSDFNACSRALIEMNYTSPGRIASFGHSHGGFVVLAAMLDQPQLYGAVISSAPAADLLNDKNIEEKEFGNPVKSRADFENLKKISPLENIRPGTAYPPLQIRTSQKDWLLPMALKFMAAFRHIVSGATALLHYEKGHGHDMVRTPAETAAEVAGMKTFIEKSIGPIDQIAYKRMQQPAAKRLAAHTLERPPG